MSENHYQSPIQIEPFNYININQCIEKCGKNVNAHYNHKTKIFEVKSQVIVKINSKTYKLVEYHFHIPSEHIINGKKYNAEIHYVFIEYNDDATTSVTYDKSRECACCSENYSQNLLVIARTIKNDKSKKYNIKNMQLKIPRTYYEYDGTLTTGDYKPVRWIIGNNPIKLNIKQIKHISKTARPIQELDGRIILSNIISVKT
jgi:carbonic anhydrase